MINAKSRVLKAINQAKGSLKYLELLEEEAVSRARKFVKLPTASERKRLREERILSGLKKLGVATQSQVEELKLRIRDLETQLISAKTGNGASTKAVSTKKKAASKEHSSRA